LPQAFRASRPSTHRGVAPKVAVVTKLVGVVKARRPLGGHPFRLQVQWEGRSTKSLIGLEDVVREAGLLPITLVLWVKEFLGRKAERDKPMRTWWSKVLELDLTVSSQASSS
jgi:hypothetical protein